MARRHPQKKNKAVGRRTFIREWREYKNLTLEKMADRLKEAHGIKITHASLGRIERALQPYNQRLLEALADELTNGDVATLLIRNPNQPEAIWSIWDRAQPGQREIITDLANTLVSRTGTDNK